MSERVVSRRSYRSFAWRVPRLPIFAALIAAAVIGTGFVDAPGAEAQQAWPDSSYLEDFTWRSIGPANMSGRITDVEGIAGTPVFYIAAATAGVWKTTNNGITFRPLFLNERVAAMGDLAIAPSDTSIVWAGTGEEDSRNSISPGRGVYKSTDGGLTWTLMGLEESQAIGRIIVHPTNPDLVYVAALGHIWSSNEERGLYRTQDGGETWERIHYISDKAGFVDLVMHPNDPNVLFAASWERVRGPYFLESGGPGSALWKSTDGGDTWTEVEGGGFPETEKGRIGLAIAHSNPDVMYALVEAETPEETDTDGDGEDDVHGSGLYRSEDGGATWTWMNGDNTRPFYYSQVRVDPSDPDFVIWSSTPVRFSKDGGRTVGSTTQGLHVDHHALWWDVEDPNKIVVGNDGGIGISWDKGGNWDFPNQKALGQFYAVSYNMDVPYRVCGGLQDNGTWCGPSRRRSGAITNDMWATVNGGDGFYAPQDMQNPDVMWAESQGGNMARINTATGARQGLAKPNWRTETEDMRNELVELEDSTDSPTAAQTARMEELRAQITADSAATQLRYNWNTPMVVSEHDPDVFYAGASSVLKSTERGDNLRIISPDLSYADTMKIRVSTETTGGITPDVTGAEVYGTIVSLAESPRHAGWLYAGTDDGRVWRTKTDGADWDELTGRFPSVPDGTYVSRIEPSHHTDDRFYVTFDGHRGGDFNPYVYVTEDDGASFTRITNGLPSDGPDYVHVIREDPANPAVLFVGTDVGVYFSMDQGASWRPFMNGLPTVPVHDLKIHPRDRELIAGTHGRSVWIVDIALLSQLAGADLDDEIVLFDPTPALQYGSPFIGGGSTGQRFFRGQSTGYGAQFAYYMPRDLSRELLAEAREARDAARDAGDEGPAPRAQVEFIILDAAGDTTQIVTSSVTPGVRRVGWNFQPRVMPEPLTASERRDSVNTMIAIQEVADSLVADGADPEAVERVAQQARNRGQRRPSRGGGGVARITTPEFAERPGESYPNRPAGDRPRARPSGNAGSAAQLSRGFFRALRERGIGTGGGGGPFGAAPAIVDPGTYRVVLRVGDRTWETELEVVRADGYVPEP